MKSNIGAIDRVIRIVTAGLLLYFGLIFSGLTQWRFVIATET
ncbi:MAG: YgaP-like transmembrane domain [Mastigocoleus sp.]